MLIAADGEDGAALLLGEPTGEVMAAFSSASLRISFGGILILMTTTAAGETCSQSLPLEHELM